MTRGHTDEEFAAAWERCGGSPIAVAKDLGVSIRGVYARRARMDKRGIRLETLWTPGLHPPSPEWGGRGWTFPRELRFNISNGSIVVISDCHWWGDISTANRALLSVLRDVKPRLMG